MKLLYLFLFISASIFSQKVDYNTKKGVVLNGYDVVSYFDKKPVKGNKMYKTNHDGVQFYFATEENLKNFKNSPKMYVPQYGGYCAYAIAQKGKKVSVNPKTYEIRDGKLYLFYNSWGTNTLEMWHKEDTEKLQKLADKYWKDVKFNN